MWLCGQWATHLKPGELEELDQAEEAREAEGHPEPELGALEAVGRDHARPDVIAWKDDSCRRELEDKARA